MAKTDRLIISYYPDLEKAEEAADLILWWDKNQTLIYLGAIGLMTMDEKGKVHTKKIGERAEGKGAKWGLLAGAVTGIFTGGLSLIGGAVAGLAIGTVTGHFFHRGLGMKDEEKADLEAHLKSGGAALAIITPEEMVDATVDTLQAKTDNIVICRMDEETAEEIEKTAEAHVASDAAEETVEETAESEDKGE